MKKLLLISSLFMTLLSHAQYSSDPSQPFAVCNAANSQEKIQALNDGNGGHFVFWLDARNVANESALYGQHLDSGGNELWTIGGKEVVSVSALKVNSYKCIFYQGGILVTYIKGVVSGYGDTLFCKQIDLSGNDVWSQPTTVSIGGGSILSHETYNTNAFVNDSGATILYSYVAVGGSSVFKFNRIDPTGNLIWPINSHSATLTGYTYFSISDKQGGFYTFSRGNGIGSTINIKHFDLQGNDTWGFGKELSNGTNTYGFGGTESMLVDDDGNYYHLWESTLHKTLLSKVNIDGSFAWSPSFIYVGDSTSYQVNPHAILDGSNVFSAWIDDRYAGQYTTIVQKTDTNGTNLWGANGDTIYGCSQSVTNPRVALSDSGSIVVAYIKRLTTDGYVQRVRSNGSLSWSNGGIAYNTSANYLYGANYVIMDEANGCNSVFWKSTFDNIYGANLCSNGLLTAISGTGSSENKFVVYPNPVTDKISLANTIKVVQIINSMGEIILDKKRNLEELNVDYLLPGIYFMRANDGESIYTARFVKL